MEKKEFKLWKKILIIVFLIIVLLFLVLTIRKIIIISSLEDKLSEYQQLDNIYSKSYNNSPNGTIIFEKYYKDNVEKDILTLSEDNKKVTQYIMIKEKYLLNIIIKKLLKLKRIVIVLNLQY